MNIKGMKKDMAVVRMNKKLSDLLNKPITSFFFALTVALMFIVLFLPFLKDVKNSSETEINQDGTPLIKKNLPAPEGEKLASFNWKYKGKEYSLNENLYESYHQFYKALPVYVSSSAGSEIEQLTMRNGLLLSGVDGDNTLSILAQKIRAIGEEKKLNENQLVELVSSFVQTIPYDQDKLDRRTSGLNGVTEKTTYPYEVLYENTGVCQDKSYLAYELLKELGYGVAIFLFPNPEDNHMAIGVKCPFEYSNYESGYCFIETTSLDNKIGIIPELIPKSRIATSDVQINMIESNGTEGAVYQPLDNVEILNKVDGKEYTGVIDTINTQKELERLRNSIAVYKRNLKVQKTDINNQETDLAKIEKHLNNYKQDGEYEKYNNLVSEFNTTLSKVQKAIKKYNKMVSASNTLITTYRDISKNFYQEFFE